MSAVEVLDSVRIAQEKLRGRSGGGRRLYLVAVAVLADKELYARALGLFYQVFAQLEFSIDKQRANPSIKEVGGALGGLKRTEAFERDLAALLGVTWRSKIHKNEASNRLCERIRTVTEEDPAVLLAYAIELYSLLLSLRWTRMWLFISHKYKWHSDILVVSSEVELKFRGGLGDLKLPLEVVERVVEESIRARDAVNDLELSLLQYAGWLTIFRGLRSPLLIYALAAFFLSTAILIGLLASPRAK